MCTVTWSAKLAGAAVTMRTFLRVKKQRVKDKARQRPQMSLNTASVKYEFNCSKEDMSGKKSERFVNHLK